MKFLRNLASPEPYVASSSCDAKVPKAPSKRSTLSLRDAAEMGALAGFCNSMPPGTGRWAGRRFQPQNIKRPELEDVDGAIAAVATGDADYVRIVYGEPLAVVSDCLRGMVRAAPGNVLWAAEFSNIEGRLQAWLAGEEWKLRAFRDFDGGKGHDLYKLSAYARSFGVRPEDVDKDQRQIGKVMELALGYQGGVGAFQRMAANYGVEVSDARAEELKTAWRDAHPSIVQCWWPTWENLARAATSSHLAARFTA